jgi:hypothetical protein
VSGTWVAPLGRQLDLLVQWLEPILARPGLVREPTFQIVVGEAATGGPGAIELEPFDALVGPVQFAVEGVVANVIPVEPFLALRAQIGAEGEYAPRVVFARTDGTQDYEPIEAVASEAVLVDSLILVQCPS